MKLSVEAVAEMTGLSPSTVRQYAWERKIGKKEGRTRVFTVAEAKKLGGLKEGSNKTRPRKSAPKRATKATSKKISQPSTKVVSNPSVNEKRSFWSFLGIGSGPKKKVGLMEVGRK